MIEELKERLTNLRLAYLDDPEKLRMLFDIVGDLIKEVELLTNKDEE